MEKLPTFTSESTSESDENESPTETTQEILQRNLAHLGVSEVSSKEDRGRDLQDPDDRKRNDSAIANHFASKDSNEREELP